MMNGLAIDERVEASVNLLSCRSSQCIFKRNRNVYSCVPRKIKDTLTLNSSYSVYLSTFLFLIYKCYAVTTSEHYKIPPS